MLIKHQEKSSLISPIGLQGTLIGYIKSVRHCYQKRRSSLHDYLQFIIAPNTILDEIGITMIARMYNIHISVVIKGRLWTTQMNPDINTCDVVLAFMGKSKFSYTVPAPDISLKLDVDLSLCDD